MNFYGRQDIIDILTKRANGLSEGYRQNIAIIGEELIGKTQAIQYWLSQYCNNYIVPIYIEVKPQEQSNFPQKFIGTLLYAFLRNSQIALKDDIDFLLEKAGSYIPNTLKSARELLSEYQKIKPQEGFIRLLELVEAFYEETNKRCCIIFDEFHRLEEFKIKDLYAHWRKQIMFGKNTMYILISSKSHIAIKILTCDLNLLFGNFERVEIGPFEPAIAQQFILERLGSLGADTQLLDFIIDFTASRPFYLEVVCSAFLKHHKANPGIRPSISSFCHAVEGLFLDAWGVFNRRFFELLNDANQNLRSPLTPKLLTALSSGLSRTLEIASNLHRTKKEILALLEQLQVCGLASRLADIYLLNDRVFAFWINCVYSRLSNTFDISVDKQRKIFSDKIEAIFNSFSAAQNMALAERIVELFNQFGNEAVKLQKKNLRLNRFQEVKILAINGKKIKEGILGRAANCLWIAGMKEGYVGEEDMAEFVDLCKKFKHNKSQKRIFITFDGIDINAKLIAKEKRILTWDVNCLNSLLEMYGKPRIVRQIGYPEAK